MLFIQNSIQDTHILLYKNDISVAEFNVSNNCESNDECWSGGDRVGMKCELYNVHQYLPGEIEVINIHFKPVHTDPSLTFKTSIAWKKSDMELHLLSAILLQMNQHRPHKPPDFLMEITHWTTWKGPKGV